MMLHIQIGPLSNHISAFQSGDLIIQIY